MNGKKEYELLVKIKGAVDRSLFDSTALTGRKLRQLNKNINSVDSVLWGGLTKSAKIAGMAAVAAGSATVVGLKKAMDTGREFEKHMDQWAATADANQAQYKKAKDAALLWGRKTTKTATESADALNYMALAGWDVERSIKALPSVLKLSEASNLDLARTSSLVVDSMAATSTEAKNLPKFLDVVAKANNRSNQSAEELMEAYLKAGATLAGLNVSVEESATAFGMLANRGKKAEEAGVGLRSALLNLTTGHGEAGKKMRELGISAFDSEGKFIGLKNVLLKLNDATKDLTEEQRNAAFAAIGGKRQVDTLNDLMQGLNHTLSDGRTEWDALYQDLNNANGALEKMAYVRMDNLWGDVKILQSALSDAGIRAYDGFAYPLRDATQLATKAVYAFSNNVSDNIGTLYPTIKRKIGDSRLFNGVIDAGNWVIENKGLVANGIGAITASITAFHTAVGANNLIRKFGGTGFLNSMLGVTRLSGISLAIGALTAVVMKEQAAAKALERQNLADHFGKIALNEKQIQALSKQIIGENLFDKITATKEQVQNIEDYSDGVDKAADSIQMLTWKVKNGLTLNEGEKTSIQGYLDDLFSNGEQGFSSAGFLASLDVDKVFGDNSVLGDKLKQAFIGLNDRLSREAGSIKLQLTEAYQKALEDGVIDVNEATVIDDLISKYLSITQEFKRYKLDAESRMIAENGAKNLTPDSYGNVVSDLKKKSQTVVQDLEQSYANNEARLDLTEEKIQKGELNPEDPGYLSLSELQQTRRENKSELENRKRDVLSKTSNFSIATVQLSYGDEVTRAADEYADYINNALDQAFQKAKESNHFEDSLGGYLEDASSNIRAQLSSNLPLDTMDALNTLYDEMEPQLAQLKAYAAEGGELTDEMVKNLNFGEKLALVLGRDDSIATVIRKSIENDPNKQEMFAAAHTMGTEFVEIMKDSISGVEARSAGESAIRSLWNFLGNTFTNMSKAFRVTQPMVYMSPRWEGGRRSYSGNGQHPAHNALGSIVTRPTLSWVAEGGNSESIIPINNTARAASLYQETGRLLSAAGAKIGGSGTGEGAFTFNITVNGNADPASLKRATNDAYQQFSAFMQRFNRDNERLAY